MFAMRKKYLSFYKNVMREKTLIREKIAIRESL